MATRKQLFVLAACVIAASLGLLLCGHGLYLYIKAGLAQWLLDSAWAGTRQTGQSLKPWPWADHHAVARLWLPGQKPLVLLSASDGSSLAFAPGVLSGSAAPGYPGHSVISAHRDTHFSGLKSLRIGDPLIIERLDGARVGYTVIATELLNVENQRLRRHDSDEPWLTLVTCYPFRAIRPGGPWRYLVHARAKQASNPL